MTNDHASPTGSLSEQPTPGCSAQDDPSIQAARDVLEFVTRVTSSTKIASNRQNAKRSTGPRTTRGKAKSRLNALTHRGFATLRLIPGEDECVPIKLGSFVSAGRHVRFIRDGGDEIEKYDLEDIQLLEYSGNRLLQNVDTEARA